MKWIVPVCCLLLFINYSVLAQNPNDVIVNEYNDSGGNCGSPEWVELLVVNGPVDLRNWYVTDEEWSFLPTINEGALQVSSNSAFSNLPMGTYIVLIDGAGTDDIDPADRLVLLFSGNANLIETGSFALAAIGDGLALVKDDDQTPGEKDAGENPIDYVSYGGEIDVPIGLTWNTAISGTEDEDSYFSNSSSFNNDDASSWVTDADGTGCGDRTQGAPNPGQDDSALPVSLTSFTTTSGNNKVTLRWVTASEQENVGFKIRRANEKDGNYQQLSSYENNPDLEGQFNSNKQTNYKFADKTVTNDVTYWYKLVDVDVNGVHAEHGPMSATPHAVGNEITTINAIPAGSFNLHPNYPNPFNPSTTLRFDIPALSSGQQTVAMIIFNSQGQKIKTLFKGTLTSGIHELSWDGVSDIGEPVSSGMYYAVLKMENLVRTTKLLLIK